MMENQAAGSYRFAVKNVRQDRKKCIGLNCGCCVNPLLAQSGPCLVAPNVPQGFVDLPPGPFAAGTMQQSL